MKVERGGGLAQTQIGSSDWVGGEVFRQISYWLKAEIDCGYASP
jgi:hypothetical protein